MEEEGGSMNKTDWEILQHNRLEKLEVRWNRRNKSAEHASQRQVRRGQEDRQYQRIKAKGSNPRARAHALNVELRLAEERRRKSKEGV
jgi:hypothetical protein